VQKVAMTATQTAVKNKTLIVIAGPTASGKTALAIELAKRLHSSIISADSRQCYQGMAIGSAQPTPEEQAAVKHYFVNQFPVTEIQTAASFERLALRWLEEIFAAQDTAIVCGGTGLYIRALCEGLDEMPEVDPAVAQEVDAGYKAHGLSWLQESLRKEDRGFAEGPEWQNPARLIRALSFKRSTGKSIMEFRSGQKKERPFRIIKYALELPREVLYARINERTQRMMEAGLLEEARALLPYRHLPPLQTVGYAELFEYFDGKCSLEQAVEKIAQHTRNYAKRQITWFKKDPDFRWVSPEALLAQAFGESRDGTANG
jgi:tRNA dimethylallyltransferase